MIRVVQRWRVALLAIMAMASLFAVPVGAQQESDDLAPLEVLNVSTLPDGRVRVEVAAPLELTGADLPASAFRVAQEGVDRPVSVQRLPDDELDVMLAIDVSGSMAGAPLDAAKAAATAFLRQLPAGSRVGLVTFGPTATLLEPLNDDFQLIADAIVGLEADGGTALYDGIALSIDQFPLARTSRRTMVVLSDGADTAETSTLAEVTEIASAAGLDLYAVMLGDADPTALTQVVGVSNGGRVVTATDAASLLAVYDEIGRLLANQYRLIFDPADSVSSSARVFIDHLGIGGVGAFEFTPGRTETAATPAMVEDGAAAAVLGLEPTFRRVEPGWQSSSTVQLAGVGFLGVALLLTGLFLFSAAPGMVAVARMRAEAVSPTDSAEKARDRATGIAEKLLQRRDRGRVVGLALDRAGLAVRPAEFVVIVFGLAILVAALGALLGGALLSLMGAALVVVGARTWLGIKGAKRSEVFNDQLSDTLQLLAGSLRAGHALPQAIEAVAREAESPTGDEFHRLTTELRLGRDLEHSLDALAERVQSEDLEWVARAIAIHREVGGDLAEVLDNINTTIRDRNYIRRQFKALSAEGRYSAYLLLALPFLVLLALLVVSPDYITLLFDDRRGHVVLVTASVSMSIGALWLRAIMKVRF